MKCRFKPLWDQRGLNWPRAGKPQTRLRLSQRGPFCPQLQYCCNWDSHLMHCCPWNVMPAPTLRFLRRSRGDTTLLKTPFSAAPSHAPARAEGGTGRQHMHLSGAQKASSALPSPKAVTTLAPPTADQGSRNGTSYRWKYAVRALVGWFLLSSLRHDASMRLHVAIGGLLLCCTRLLGTSALHVPIPLTGHGSLASF